MGKTAFIFSGQGSQYAGMGKSLYDNIEVSKNIFNAANESLGFDIAKLCFEGPREELDKTENTQPAILTMSIAALMALKENNINCDFAAGLSLGEYSAHVCSGSLDFASAVKLVKKRGKYMQEAVPEGKGTMAAVIGLTSEDIRVVCSRAGEYGIIEPSNFNCPGQIVVGGEIKAVEAACQIAKEMGARRAIMLSVSAPFHTSMLKPAAEKLETELKDIVLSPMNIPVVTNVTGDFVESTDDIKPLLKKQVMSSVLWEKSVRTMIENGADTFVEIGPGKVLSGFIKKISKEVTILNVEDVDSLHAAVDKLKAKKEEF